MDDGKNGSLQPFMTEEQAKNHYENPFDITKVWSHAEYPLIEVGVLELNRNPENFFAEVE